MHLLKILKFNNWYYFLFLCATSLLFTYLWNTYIYTDSLYYSTLNEQFTAQQIKKILNLRGKWMLVSYLFIPLFIILRIFYTSLFLFLGDLFQESHWGFKRLFNITLKTDFIFVLSTIAVFYYRLFLGGYNTVDELNTNPFSLLAVAGRENIPNWLVFTYNSINLFEFIYLITIAVFIRYSTQIGYIKALIFSLLTYGVGNYLYIAGVSFFYLNFSS